MEEDRSKKKDADTSKVSELEKYWQVVRDNPSDFAGWTYLLHFIEQENNLEAARQAFKSFFTHYPYCYGYWKKYADMEKNASNFDAAEKIFEEGTNAIPLSVDLWIHYINFYKGQQAESEGDEAYEKIKSLFKRALIAAGREFRSDRLWDLYITWEEENKKLKEVTVVYDELLTIPTQLYSHNFEKFCKHVKKNNPREILSTDEFLELRKIIVENMSVGVVADDEENIDKATEEDAPPGMDVDEAPPGLESEVGNNVEKDLLNAEETELLKKKIIEIRKVQHEKNEIEVGKRWSFEEAIKRPYFHVKPLERAQLKNWKDYLDFEIENGTHENIVILFERCMIACALYEDMWLKYAKYLEGGHQDAAAEVYDRACRIHLPKKPNIHFQWALFAENNGNPDEAALILNDLEERISDMLEITIRRINLERRRGNDEKVNELYTKCIAEAKTSQMSSHFATKYARYLYKLKGDFAQATTVLKEALKNDPSNPYIFLQLVDVGFQQEPMDQALILEAFELALNSDINNDQKLLFSQRKLEFLEDFTSNADLVHNAFDDYSKMFKSHYSSRKRAADECEESKEKKQKTEMNGTANAAAAAVPAAAAQTAAPVQDASQFQYANPSAWAGYAQNSYGYQQAWPGYGTTNYYSSH